ncbi:MAG: hypothetical protein IID48_22080 [Proteobacteria bacterium]|nr:hypothetical protein [Pseudomonadota bacterium]
MTAVSEYKTQIEEIQKRLNGANGHKDHRIGEFKERLSAVRSSLLRKQEIIDAQTREIAELRDENGQLSDMLGQALAALNEQSKDGLQEIVRSFDSEFSGLLSDEGAEVVVAQTVAAQAVAVQAANPEPEVEAEAPKAPKAPKAPEAPEAKEAGSDGGGRRDPPPEVIGVQQPRSDDAGPEAEIENQSPALRRIMGRRRR